MDELIQKNQNINIYILDNDGLVNMVIKINNGPKYKPFEISIIYSKQNFVFNKAIAEMSSRLLEYKPQLA